MDCHEYIDQFLSADADDELSAPERYLVEEHLRSCHQCHARLGEELALKASVRRYVGMVKAPADVRLRIRAALGEAAERGPQRPGILGRAGRFNSVDPTRRTLSRALEKGVPGLRNISDERGHRADAARRWLAIQLKRAQYLAPVALVVIALAASTVMLRGHFRSISGQAMPVDPKSVPAFDFAIARLNQLSQGFAPNVPAEAFSRVNGAYFAWVEDSDPLHHVSDELPDISSSYEKMQMPPEFCDFALAGYDLAGGRIDRMPDGAPVTYTLYRKQANSILSIGLKEWMGAPQGGYWFDTHALYSYRGYSLCLTISPIGHFASIIVTRAPLVELLRDIAAGDMAVSDR